MFNEKLDLSSLGEKTGYLRSIEFPDFEFAFNRMEAIELLDKNQTPINFTIYDSRNAKEIEIPATDIDKLLKLEVITKVISELELDSCKKLMEHMEQENDFELDIDFIEMENGEKVHTKSSYQEYLNENIIPRTIILANGKELPMYEYLTLLNQSAVKSEYQEANLTPTSPNENVMSQEEIEAFLLGISPEKWDNATPEQKAILIQSYQEKMGVMPEESPKSR